MFKGVSFIFIAVVFLTESMFPCAEVSEIAKVPELWNHFRNHQIKTPDLTFLDFLDLHYSDSKHYNDEPRNHERLPFSKGRHHVLTLQLATHQPHVSFSNQYSFVMTIEEVVYVESRPVILPSMIWQPPRA
jgi:hypothetical protein